MRAATIAMEADALQQYQKRVEAPRATTAMEAEALQQFQKSVEAARAAQKASETYALVERQNIAMEAEALQQFQKSVDAARAAQRLQKQMLVLNDIMCRSMRPHRSKRRGLRSLPNI